MLVSDQHISSCDLNQLLQAIKVQNEVLMQWLALEKAPVKRQSVPMKRLPLKTQLKQDFKTAFYKKWGIES